MILWLVEKVFQSLTSDIILILLETQNYFQNIQCNAKYSLFIFLFQLIRTFKFEPTAKEDIPLEMRILLQPKVPIRVKFLDR